MSARVQAWALAALVLTCLALSALAVLSSNGGLNVSKAIQGGDPTGRRQQKTEDAQTDAPLPPSFVALFFGGDLEEAAAYCASDQQDKAKGWIVKHWCDVKRTDIVSAGAALVTVIVTAFLLGVGILQWRVVAGQRDIAAEQATVSKVQANIQQAVADLERPTLFVTRLGSVEFHPCKYPSDGTERCQPVVEMRFANFGRTPAVLLAIEGEVFMTRKGSPPPPGWTTTTQLPTHLRRFQIMATGEDKGATVEITGRPIPAGYAGAYRDKQLGVFVWGRFVYVDPFGARLETRYALVPGGGGEPMPGNYPGDNGVRTYTRDDPDAPHRRYGA